MTAVQTSIIREFISFMQEHEDYTYAQAHYSFFRPNKDKKRTNKLSDILELTDEQVLTNIEKAKIIENER